MDNAIPMTHSMLPVVDFIDNTPENKSDRAVANLSYEPGWEILKGEIEAEIARLREVTYEGEDVREYGFKCLASSLCITKLEWILSRVRNTERTIRESDNTGD